MLQKRWYVFAICDPSFDVVVGDQLSRLLAKARPDAEWEPPLADSMTPQTSLDDIKEVEDDASPQDDYHLATLSNIGRLQRTTEGVRNISLQMDRELLGRQVQSLDQVRNAQRC